MPEFYQHIVDSRKRLDVFVTEMTGRSRMFVKEQISRGRIDVNCRTASKPSKLLAVGDVVRACFVEDDPLALLPVPFALEVVHEDEHLLIVDKPQGVVVHPAHGHRGETLVHYLLHHLQSDSRFGAMGGARPGIVHRLDRGTSGLLLVAKSRGIQEALARQFRERTVQKEYESVVWGKLASHGKFLNSIGRHFRDRKRMSSKTLKGRDALTEFKCIGAFEHFSHVELYPRTGRTHQIRVHLSEAGHPIIGDGLYGHRRKTKNLSLVLESMVESLSFPCLHAKRLTLEHPATGQTLSVCAPRPAHFERLLDSLNHFD